MDRGREILSLTVTLGQDYDFRGFVGLDGTPENPIGVLRDPGKAGQIGDVTVLGTEIVRVGTDGVTKGLGVTSDTDGTAIETTSGDVRLGIAKADAVEGEDVEIILVPLAVEP